MKKNTLLTISSLIVLLFSLSTNKTQAAELIINGGFETGNHTGWTVVNAANNYWTWAVTPAGGGFTDGTVTPSSPIAGSFSSHGGFCCNSTNNPEYIQQQITIPAGQTAELRWWDKIQSDLASFCPVPSTCGSNVWRVQILNTSNTVLQTLYTFTAVGGNSYNTGWVNHLVNLNAYQGQTIRIRFSATYNSSVSGNLNGPGRNEVDQVSVQSPVIVTAANASVSGRVLTSGGRGISLASVTLTDIAGNRRAVNTNQFGMFYFDGVESGQTYIVNVEHGKYFFPNNSRVINVGEEVRDIDFQANP